MKLRDFDWDQPELVHQRIATLLDEVAQVGVKLTTTRYGLPSRPGLVSFVVEDDRELRAKAIAKGIELSLASAEAAAKAMGVRLAEVKSVSVRRPPRASVSSYLSGNTPASAAARSNTMNGLTVEVNVTVSYGFKK